MVHLAKIVIFIFLLGPSSLKAQGDLIKFNYVVNQATGHQLALSEFLQLDVPQSPSSECSSTFEFFYFRVAASNVVDSIYHEGTLNSKLSDKIISNIKKTKNYWVISEKDKANKKQFWFVYPYFDFGGDIHGNSKCSPEQKRFQEVLIQIAENLGKIELFLRRNNATIIQAAKRGGSFGEL